MPSNYDAIAIDGPAASGKSTVGQMLADRLGYLFLDTGCMYRAVTLAALNAGVDVMDETAVTAIALQLDMDILPYAGENDGRHYSVLLDGRDVTWDIRTPAVDANVSQVSKYAGVRAEMVRRQRDFGRRGRVVMVGRDIGTVVMPDAPLKIYITATPEERARRRWRDRTNQGHPADYAAILADVKRRDAIDSGRALSPLRPAADAIIVDTSDSDVEQVLADLLQLMGQPQPPLHGTA